MTSLPVQPRPVHTHCPFCAFQCGMTLTGPHDVAASDFPVNNGQMCIKGFSSGEMLGHPQRLTTPRLHGREVTWDEALGHVAAGIERLRSAHGPAAVGAFGSGALTNEKAYTLGKFVRCVLRSPNVDYNGRYCMASAAAAMNRSLGVDRGLPFPVADLARTKTLLLWGANPADTLPPIWQYVEAMRAAGGTLVVVDPRRTATAAEADLHLQPRPGGDLALALGLLHVAVEEGLVDRDYLAGRTSGFDLAAAAAGQCHPAYVEQVAGVDEPKLRAAARHLAGKPAMLLSGRGPEQQSKGVDGVHALINLMLALGHVGRPAAGYGTLTGQGNGQGGREHGQKADQLPGYRLIEDPEHRRHVAGVWGLDPDDLPSKGKSAVEMIDTFGTDVRGLLVFGSNLPVATPDGGRVADRLRALDLLVVCDAFENDTTALADVVLPVTQWAEEDGTMTNLEGRVIRRNRAVEPPAGCRSDLWVLRELAARLGGGRFVPTDDPETIFDELRRASAGGPADYAGISYARIDAERGVHWPCPAEDHPGTPRLFADRFPTPDGRARLFPVRHRRAGEEPDEAYPVWFTTGRYKQHYNSGAQTRRIKPLLDARPAPRLELHPLLAGRLGLADGVAVDVVSRRGRVRFDAAVTPDLRPDTVFAPFHYGGKRAANLLTNPALDPTSRMPEFKVCAVRLEPADPTADPTAEETPA